MELQGTFRVEWAKPSDAPFLLTLMGALYGHEAPDAPAPTLQVTQRHIAQLISPAASHKLAIAWTEGYKAAGLAAVGRFLSIGDPRPERWTQFELEELFVLAEFRGAGLGQLIMDWIEHAARASGACRIDWHVRKDNLRGIMSYERQGGRIVENRISMGRSLLDQ